MTTTRPLSEAERQAIAARYGATCDLPAVTVCPAGRYSAELAVSEWHAKVAKSKARGLARMKGKR